MQLTYDVLKLIWATNMLDFSRLSTYRLKVPEPTNERGSCVQLVHDIVMGLPRVHPNTTKKRIAHCYPLRAPVKAVDR